MARQFPQAVDDSGWVVPSARGHALLLSSSCSSDDRSAMLPASRRARPRPIVASRADAAGRSAAPLRSPSPEGTDRCSNAGTGSHLPALAAMAGLVLLASAAPAMAQEDDLATKVADQKVAAGHPLGDGRRLPRVLDAGRLRLRRGRPDPREEHQQHHDEEPRRTSPWRPSPSGSVGFAIMFGDGNPLHRPQGLVPAGRRQLAGDRRLRGGLRLDHLDRRPAGRQVHVPARLRRHGGDDRLRGDGRADEVPLVPDLLVRHQRLHLPGRRPLDLGRRLAGEPRACGTSPARRSCTRPAPGWP